MKAIYTATLSLVVITIMLLPATVSLAAGDAGAPGAAKTLENPLAASGISTIGQLLIRAIRWLLGISAFLTMLAFIYGGIRLITAAGNDQYVTLGKTILIWAAIGFAVILLSFALLDVITGVLGL